MDKETQRIAWSCLPKEFKEEVKRMYRIADSDVDQMIATIMLENVFGLHNLTSDAEGEEMLTVSRKQVMDAFNSAKIIGSSKMSSKMLAGAADMCINTFKDLFGSKCMPDNVDCSEKKSRKGKKIRIGNGYYKEEMRGAVGVIAKDCGYHCYVEIDNTIYDVPQSELKHYEGPDKK